jgi:hypothetical protein
MSATFRPISTTSVMCTVQTCENPASFIFTGPMETGAGVHWVVRAFCNTHATDVAERLGYILTDPLHGDGESVATRIRIA